MKSWGLGPSRPFASLVFIDTETTGFDPSVHEVIEIALVEAVFVRGRLKTRGRLEVKIRPERLDAADAEALRVNGYSESGWRDAMPAAEAWRLVADTLNMCGRPMMAGHNVAFDLGFMRAAWKAHAIEPPCCDYRTIDTYAYALPYLASGAVRSISLTAIRDHLGIETGRAHSAMADALASFEIARLALDKMRPSWWRRMLGRG